MIKSGERIRNKGHILEESSTLHLMNKGIIPGRSVLPKELCLHTVDHRGEISRMWYCNMSCDMYLIVDVPSLPLILTSNLMYPSRSSNYFRITDL
jgi:hypothetical protein